MLNEIKQCFDCRCVHNKEVCPECKSDKNIVLCEKQATHIFKTVRKEIPTHDHLVSGVKLCEVCKKPICPICDAHDVVALSRITGYISSISGWGEGKLAELKDRKRYDLNNLN